MTTTPPSPAFLDASRPDTPDLVVPQGILPFYLDQRPVRGRLVRPGVLTDTLLTRHDNPDVVLQLAGEALALVAALASSLKFQGSFSLQPRAMDRWNCCWRTAPIRVRCASMPVRMMRR